MVRIFSAKYSFVGEWRTNTTLPKVPVPKQCKDKKMNRSSQIIFLPALLLLLLSSFIESNDKPHYSTVK